MEKSRISWMPVRLLDDMQKGRLSWEEWLRSAPKYGLDGVEVHHTLLESRDKEYLKMIVRVLEEINIKVSLITCSPDFAHPDPATRERYLEEMKSNIQAAHDLGAFGVRVTTGIRHPMVRTEDAIPWVVDNLTTLAEFGQAKGVVAALENHYKDRISGWPWPDLAQKAEVFLEVFRRLKNTPTMVNFDASNQIMIGEDPLTILNEVKDRVVSMHASDRFKGSYQHSVVGEGEVDFDAIFRILKEVGFNGWVSIEDGNPYGDEGFKSSVSFIKKKVSQYWE